MNERGDGGHGVTGGQHVNEGEDDGEHGITDGQVGDVQTREGTVVSQIGGWVTCERKGTVAVVSLMGDM